MLQVVVAVAVLLAVALIKKIPKIGGNIAAGLFLAGVATLICSGNFAPSDWISSFINGLNRLSWIMALAASGAIFAEISNYMGTVDTVMCALNARFGNNPRALIVCIICVLCLAGAILGDAVASATVIGTLTFLVLVSMGIEYERISAIVMMGASIGSIFPLMSQAIALSATLCGADHDAVTRIGYITAGICLVFTCIYSAFFLIKKENRAGMNSEVEIKITEKSAFAILKNNFKSLLPAIFLIVVVLIRTIPAIKYDIGLNIIKGIVITTINETPITLYDVLANTTLLNGLTNGTVLCIVMAICFSMIFKDVRENRHAIFAKGFKNVSTGLTIQIACAFMLGTFYECGSIDAVANWAANLNINVLKIGGGFALMLVGMLTGSQSTAQSSINSFFGPALVASGISPTFAAIAAANLAAAGQGAPPADITTFVICALLGSEFNRKVNPLKSMFYSLPLCIVFALIGFFFLYCPL